MAESIFQNPTKTLPKKADDQTVRIDFAKQDIAGPPPSPPPSPVLGIVHGTNRGSRS